MVVANANVRLPYQPATAFGNLTKPGAYDYVAEPLADCELRAAQCYIQRSAQSPEDAALLLDMLGLTSVPAPA